MRVTVLSVQGSTPREAGAFMLVSPTGQTGTIGGGDVEWTCLSLARAALASGTDGEGACPGEMRFVLGPETGQCCGGAMVVRFSFVGDLAEEEEAERSARGAWPRLAVFGAGHVGRALMRCASFLPLSLRWIDPREEEFGPVPQGVETRVSDAWEEELAALRAGDGVLVMTPSHRLDALIAAAALERGDLAYVGLIGSRTKRRRFEAAFLRTGLSQAQIAPLVCPVGDRGVRDKRPEIIAALIAAELAVTLVARDGYRAPLRTRRTETGDTNP
ncbi:xanthine dehydrogenase XdhC [Swaminathania salitolerans LMG 21291]|uniref:Xanthine dehydrogenase accessory protein XdhC n=2 Tax=Swaminathania salitolerans TaxID=182838 RepID=A0A511BT94_9PROT|nr:xanthine dehydrogenase XdhC [Swaminathania salitolerans LMG 21291]GEL01188.1 xanthine dehydrogenase accessory protein XdhC [Swaminathania salitolerans]